jgi:hypothetical protein
LVGRLPRALTRCTWWDNKHSRRGERSCPRSWTTLAGGALEQADVEDRGRRGGARWRGRDERERQAWATDPQWAQRRLAGVGRLECPSALIVVLDNDCRVIAEEVQDLHAILFRLGGLTAYRSEARVSWSGHWGR